MTLKTDKDQTRLTLEAIVADLRHAYGFLQAAVLLPQGQLNVAGLIARQIKRIENIIEIDDRSTRVGGRYIYCPFQCGYRTAAHGDEDRSARAALAAHLQRLQHRLGRTEAYEMAAKSCVTSDDPPVSGTAVSSTAAHYSHSSVPNEGDSGQPD